MVAEATGAWLATKIFTVLVSVAWVFTALATVIWKVLLPVEEQETLAREPLGTSLDERAGERVQPEGGMIEEGTTTLVALVEVQDTVKLVLMVAEAGTVRVTVGGIGLAANITTVEPPPEIVAETELRLVTCQPLGTLAVTV